MSSTRKRPHKLDSAPTPPVYVYILLEPILCRRARYDPRALLYLWGTNFCISYSSNCRIRISSYSQESEASQHSTTFCRQAKPEAALQTGSMFNIHRSWEALGKDKVKCPEQDYREVWYLRELLHIPQTLWSLAVWFGQNAEINPRMV